MKRRGPATLNLGLAWIPQRPGETNEEAVFDKGATLYILPPQRPGGNE